MVHIPSFFIPAKLIYFLIRYTKSKEMVWCVFIGGVSELHLGVSSYGEEGFRSGIVVDVEEMGSFTLTVYHGGRFGYEEGTL
ncbi:hypothetical protein Ahy_B08g089562 isoform C [Arachis hypogaea]|uniref:Uncharacterized protein n=1 Tax=Arachis hypogaea TaxID=3818 RepID=A0A444XY66_ARAHY|nr:hypothetical protein Ahy_B08g089562 isoform C [Arachis hypogaea]